LTTKLVEVPAKRTMVAPVKRVPVIVTCDPTAPLVGVKLSIDGRSWFAGRRRRMTLAGI
jgi:hypothetical protein